MQRKIADFASETSQLAMPLEILRPSVLFQAALSQLPMGDLNALLRYICQYMPMAPSGAMPAVQNIAAPGSSSDEVCHCLPAELY